MTKPKHDYDSTGVCIRCTHDSMSSDLHGCMTRTERLQELADWCTSPEGIEAVRAATDRARADAAHYLSMDIIDPDVLRLVYGPASFEESRMSYDPVVANSIYRMRAHILAYLQRVVAKMEDPNAPIIGVAGLESVSATDLVRHVELGDEVGTQYVQSFIEASVISATEDV